MKRVLLTGASGFVGSHVLRHFLKNTDWEIVCLVTYRHKGMPERIKRQVEGLDDDFDRVIVIKHDLTDVINPVLAHEIGVIDYIVNLASDSHVDRSMKFPADNIQNNVSLMCNLLDYARLFRPEKFIQISTDEVYGPAAPGHAHREWKDLLLPSNPYSASKAAQESICFSYWRTYGVPIIITNTMNIIGEMQDPEKYVPMIIRNVLAKKPITIHASPNGKIGSRFYLHARNQSDALMFIAKNVEPRMYKEGAMPKKYHVVGEIELDNLQLAKRIAELTGCFLNYSLVDFHSSRPGHDLRYALDGTEIKKLGWSPPFAFDDSLEKTVKWYLNNQHWLDI